MEFVVLLEINKNHQPFENIVMIKDFLPENDAFKISLFEDILLQE